ncbi:MAG: class I SAM-dependent methyltransferase [Acidobacteria bacterium]|nr:class I SAM-dependent methyltransferase [Acidobacteriota bacterium]
MRAFLLLAGSAILSAASFPWTDIPAPLAHLLAENGLTAHGYSDWVNRHTAATKERLAAGSAEHIAYFLLQTKSLGSRDPLNPAAEARRYFDSLPAAERQAFLRGAPSQAAFNQSVQHRIHQFFNQPPTSQRHRILREIAGDLGWPPDRVVQTAFRFLIQRSATEDADTLYQARGLSADPFPASMEAIGRGLAKSGNAAPRAVLLIGPGADLGSRFGVEDAKPVRSPQASALLTLLGSRPSIYDCIDIRPEVAAALADGPCRATTLDLVVDPLAANRYNLAVATNVLVYLDDNELALALANIARSLRPGGCLLHNDARFAARLFGEAAGIPVTHFESVSLGRRDGREQLDRVAVHCKISTVP